MITTNDIRTSFLDYFGTRNHAVLPSSSLVPQNDPTLMFANAGMNQFKDIFTGNQKPDTPRAATAQKCVRAGGKHNDLDNVGYTARHHTFFEMLGNFSFGDYFKEDAIQLAWNLITKEWAIDPAKLCVTIYHTDDEAFTLWKKIASLAEEKIIRIPTADNFWAMGDTGPCGPCSEIFYDHGSHIPGGPPGSAEADGDRFIEIWNLVFMQFEKKGDGKQISLPKPSIDTGMGLERVAAVLQGVHDNYDIDLFKNLIASIEDESRVANRESREENTRLEPRDSNHVTSHRVIADHLRSCSFLIADGVLPSNEGRGYVLRRIMRRAMRYAHQLGCKEPLMHRLVPALVTEMGGQYTELSRAQALITSTLLQEEERFKHTLERGLKLLEEETATLTQGGVLEGETAFKLYDTYGFPLDLTQDILRGRGMSVDIAGFDAAMESQKDMARAAHKGAGSKVDTLWFELKETFGPTEFKGYEQDSVDATVLALVKNGTVVEDAAAGDEIVIILDRTPFYGESGGQVGDTGWVYSSSHTKQNTSSSENKNATPSAVASSNNASHNNLIATIVDTQKPLDGFHVHYAKLNDALKVGDTITIAINTEARDAIRANHSATHLLHAALRKTLGAHITQKGSLVDAEKLRFDVSHPKAISKEDLAKVETEVNHLIWQNSAILCEEMSPKEAEAKGAMALFGEKYGDRVRVLSMGQLGDNNARPDGRASHELAEQRPTTEPKGAAVGHYSVELCGGTHATRTGDIGLFKIVSESAVAAGIRRIEAVTRSAALSYLTTQDTVVRNLALDLKVPQAELATRVETLQQERKKLEKELADIKRKLASGGGKSEAPTPEMLGSIQFIAKIFDEVEPKDLRSLAEQFLQPLGKEGVVLVASTLGGKASVVAAVSKELSVRINAVDLAQCAAEKLGGKGGGGRPEMAQAGGPETGNVQAAITAIREHLLA